MPAGLALSLALRHVPQMQLPPDIEESLEAYFSDSGVRAKHAKQKALQLTDDLKAISRYCMRFKSVVSVRACIV